MMGRLGFPEMAIILVIALVLFGPSKLAGLGKGLGEGIRSFKLAIRDEGPLDQENSGKS